MRFGWRRLQVVAALALLASLVVPMVISLTVEPFLLSMAAPFIIGLLVMLRWPRVGAALLGIVSLVLVLFSAPFIAEALIHPESLADFIPLVVLTLSLLAGVIAAIPSFRQGRMPDTAARPARAIAVVSGAIVVASVIVAVLAFAGIESEPARGGDILVVAEDIEFHPTRISADGSDVSVHVTNRDDTRHTFTIDELGVDLNVPPNSNQRVSFVAEPGTYEFYCRPHVPGMEGELVIE